MVKRPTTNDFPVCSIEILRRSGSDLEWRQLFRNDPTLHPRTCLVESKKFAYDTGRSTLDVAVFYDPWEVVLDVVPAV